MDNRINEIRRKISALRSEMLAREDLVRDQIAHDLDCTASSIALLAMRTQLATLLRDWKAAGGGERLPTLQERLKENYRSPVKRMKAPAQISSAAGKSRSGKHIRHDAC